MLEAADEEIKVLAKMDHEGVMKILGVYQDRSSCIIVTPLLRGGDVASKLEVGAFTEAEAQTLMKQLLTSLSYVHSCGYVHRDVKPENIVLKAPGSLEAQLVDFGACRRLKTDELATEIIGSPDYIAPELLKTAKGVAPGYGKEVDIWSAGVILYSLVCGFQPFYGDTTKAMFQQILKGEIDECPEYLSLSASCRSLIKQMLTLDPEYRPSASELLEHEWFHC
eukprot:GFYU01002052.1.p1 GENE.GFYU01002052.1~~GFYU01002052.1.p1  ORF type:complete len:257 (-),score=47.28 GFYU01002052.1:317-985(-)